MTDSSTTCTDLLVIGGGPAGLSATLTFARLGRPATMYDSQTYRNASTRVSHTIPAFDGGDPVRWREKVLEQMDAYPWVETRDGKIVDLKRLENDKRGTRFEAVAAGGKKVIARKVVLATGIKDILPAIPGLQETWGNRAIHCIYCHGTETRGSPLAFLLASGPASMFNVKIVETALKLWPSLGHPALYFLTNGLDVDSPADLDKTGLRDYLPAIKQRNYGIVTDKLASVEETPNGLLVHFESHRTMLPLGHIAVLPESWTPNPDAAPWLNEELLGADLAPTGTIAMLSPERATTPAPIPPRMGDDPTTPTPGLFWAGNSGSLMANVNISVAQGQMAGVVAGDQLGEEDLKALV